MHSTPPASVSAALSQQIQDALARQGGWLSFDRFMALALYAPDLGYYTNGSRKFGTLPQSGSDFVTAPELSPLFGRALAVQLAQALRASNTREIWEFGAGSGALAEQIIDALQAEGLELTRYTIVDLSGSLKARQSERLQRFGKLVQWADALPEQFSGVIVGNEVLDAMPVQLLAFDGQQWLERGVVREGEQFAFADRPTRWRPPEGTPLAEQAAPGTVTEIHPQAEAFIRTLAQQLVCGAAFFIDYGFPEAEYYHPQRSGGTLMCHRAHEADGNPLVDVGLKDITSHVNFTGIALAAQNAGLDVIGYTTQAHFLINCGIVPMMAGADLRTTTAAQTLLMEHEMGELFKVIALARGCDASFTAHPVGFANGDRTHRL